MSGPYYSSMMRDEDQPDPPPSSRPLNPQTPNNLRNSRPNYGTIHSQNPQNLNSSQNDPKSTKNAQNWPKRAGRPRNVPPVPISD